MYKTNDNIELKTPTIRLIIFVLLLYFFGAFLISVGILYFLSTIGASSHHMKQNISEGFLLIHIFIMGGMTYFLLKKYTNYLLLNDWKKNVFKYVKAGLKWSLPLIIVLGIPLLIPTTREKLVTHYLSMESIPISKVGLLIFFVWVLLSAVFEEIVFRGMILQQLKYFFSTTLSIVLAAFLFSISHFIASQRGFNDLFQGFFIGILCGFAFKSTQSTISAFVPHLLNNMICIIFIWSIR